MPVGLSPLNNGAACDALYDRLKGDYQTVHVRSLTIPEDRLRKIDPKTIPGLADSIREVGQISPIGVKRIGTSQYRVVYGARRVMAFQLLLDEAMAKAIDPNKDPAVYKYSNMHVMLYRDAIDDETCQELEIRENLDRKELTVKERTAHALLLAACIKRREQKRTQSTGHVSKVSRVGKTGDTKSSFFNGPGAPIADAVAQATGIERQTLRTRVYAASKSLETPVNLDCSPPDKLEDAARALLKTPARKQGARTKGSVPSPGLKNGNRVMLGLNICASDSPAFALWIRKRYPASFTLDQVRAFRDALAGLVQELEQADTGC